MNWIDNIILKTLNKHDDTYTVVSKGLLGLWISLLVLDVSVVSSSLPYVYVTDRSANCGARFLVHYGTNWVVICGLCAVGALAAREALSTFRQEMAAYFEGDPRNRYRFLVFLGLETFLGLAFFFAALNQVDTLGNPPLLPEPLPTISNSDKLDAHACTVLAQPH